MELSDATPIQDDLSKKNTWWKQFKAKSAVAHTPVSEIATEVDVTENLASPPPDDTEAPFAWLARAAHLSTGDKPLASSLFTLEQTMPTQDQQTFLDEISQSLRGEQVESNPSATDFDGEQVPEIPSVIPMRFFIGVSEDQMTAWGFLLPPENGGPCLEEADLLAQIKLRGICFGVDVSAILAAIAQEQWGKLIVIAQGVAAREGQDGQIVDHYARDKTIHLTETSQNFMDYKNLNWLQKIAAETTICEIIPPVPAEDGHTVLGMVLSAPVPKMPDVPAGQNTKLSEDGTALLASCDGQLSFTKGLFRIDCSLQIKDDVDNSVGNLDVFGDVSVGGNVMDGFSIRATGTITVNGLVEGAFLYAGKDIRVSLGAKGHLSGTLEAGGTIRCRYLENCTAKAGGSITAETIINSTVSSGDSIFALNGQGTIIGGKLTALKTIEAKVIGNEFNIQNTISVGIDSSQEEAAEQLKKELAILERSIDEMEKAIVYLSGKPEDSEKAVTLLPQLKLKLSVSRMSYTRKSRALEGIVAISTDCNPQIIAHMIYPVTNISIRKQKRTLQITSRMCRVYLEDGEIIVGKL